MGKGKMIPSKPRLMFRGLTFVEVLVVLAIVSVLFAILFPVFRNAKQQAKITSTLSRLRQLHVAIMIYQADSGQTGGYGPAHEMGLPGGSEFVSWGFYPPPTTYRYPKDIYLSACGPHPSDTSAGFTYWAGSRHEEGQANWLKNINTYRDNMILLSDLNCTDPGVDIYNSYDSKRGLGVLLSGQLIRFVKVGDCKKVTFWASPPPGG